MVRTYKATLLWKIFVMFLKVSPITFGGGYAMIPLLEKAVTEQKHWLNREEIIDVLAVSQIVPGSVAVNAATFIGYKLAGTSGALSATLGIITPTFLIVVLLAALFLGYQQNPIIQAAFLGIRPAVVALILFAAFKMGKSAILDKTTTVLAVASLIIFWLVPVNPLVILLLGGATGILIKRNAKKQESKSF
ncbi:chromate transporter [Collibacillus ludicampi]|nr:chromate transporter [Collibacillus ludicampi]